MSKFTNKIVAIILTLAIIFGSNISPVQAAVVSSWAHIEFIQVETPGNPEVIGEGYIGIQNPQTLPIHNFDGWLLLRVKTGTTTGFQVHFDWNLVANADMQISRTSGIDPLSKQSFWISDILIPNVSKYADSSKASHYLQIITRNPSNISLTSANNLNIRKPAPIVTPAPAPATVDYSSASHMITGVSPAMEYRLHTTAWSSWASISPGFSALNVYTLLSTTRETKIEVRTRSPQSQAWSYTIPAIESTP
ncbi:MAG: hypothetical protein FWH04_09690 [Oscillospiraceae bacterium]|nr:hypothetical protein [Oscillospiraceae bacterium]